MLLTFLSRVRAWQRDSVRECEKRPEPFRPLRLPQSEIVQLCRTDGSSLEDIVAAELDQFLTRDRKARIDPSDDLHKNLIFHSQCCAAGVHFFGAVRSTPSD